MKFYTLEEMTDKHIGKRGTPERESFEAELEAALIGASIKEARKSMNLTQKELGGESAFKPPKFQRLRVAGI